MFYILSPWLRNLNTGFTLFTCFFQSVKLIKNVDPDKYVYTSYGIGFNLRSEFSLPDGNMRENAIIFGADMSSSVHIDNKGKDILLLDKGPTQGLEDTTLTAETKYPINFTQSRRRFLLSWHYKGSNSFLFVNTTKIYQFKAKDSQIKNYEVCLGNVSKYLKINNVKKRKTKRNLKTFFVDFNSFDINDIPNIHKYLIRKTWYKSLG